ncbi:MAG: excinuclease ABC subunit A [Verrucomicrobiales bacterium]|nr:excinuclease ABC subunit A [Verrucomicrobiales bacterium]
MRILKSVGLGYLTLGQPTSQLSGGEAQRLKLVGELLIADRGAEAPAGQKLIILDEPTTGLHYEDIRALLGVLQSLADQGHTLLVIEHNMEVVKCADYVLDLGPEAGDRGGKVVAAGPPEEVAAADSRTAPFLAQALRGGGIADRDPVGVAEPAGPADANNFSPAITVSGAKHHNLKNLSLRIPREKMVVITGLSGSGKSTLAFDLLFAEGQRRYLDCLNSYARQFIEQLEKPRVDAISGIPPAVAIEQRTTRGGHKSTVATVTELYHFMRLLYAKLGVQHDPATGEPCVQQTTAEIAAQIKKVLRRHRAAADGDARLLAPLVRNRKGKYAELAAWAGKKKFPLLRVDGKFIAPADFKPLDRYREHNIDVVVATVSGTEPHLEKLVSRALELGHGTAMLTTAADAIFSAQLFSPATGASFAPLEPNMFSYNSPHGWCPRCQGYGTIADLPADADLSAAEQEQQEELARERLEADRLSVCPECGGARLNPAARAVRFAGRPVTALNALSVNDCLVFFRRRKFTGRAAAIAGDILPEILQRLQFLRHVGLGYLNLDRAAPTLSGGEAQRIRLAAQLGSNLRGVLYILDEPTIGLHPRDNAELIKMLRALQRRGNSLVIVEHDEDTMRAADHIIDLGPGAGVNGGEVIASGTWRQLTRNRQSLTGKLLGRPLRHPLRGRRRPIPPHPRNQRNPAGQTTRPPAERSRVKEQHPLWLTVSGASANNLKNLTVSIPLGRLVGVSGVSGSGKSTLMRQAIIPAVSAAIAKRRPPAPLTVSGLGGIAKLVEVDQSPIGKTSRSTVSTYIGLMDWLRKLLALTPLAKTRGFTPTHFSYNAGTGRCPACLGQGLLKIEMNFLPTAYVPCDQCGGKRWTEAVLDVTYRDKNIHDILSLSVDEAVNFFDGQPSLQVPLTLLQETGLGYLTLGQTSPTLSGGEAQRIRLVAELAGIRLQELRRRLATRAALTGKTLYLLEEPTVGLHLADVQKLLAVLHQLVDAGNTVMVIEHHLDLLAECDYLIDLGPESAAAGGRLIARGTPEQIAANARSHTGQYLRRLLKL